MATRYVHGVGVVPMSPEEEAAFRAQQEADTASPPNLVPDEVTKLQMLRALRQLGFANVVATYVASQDAAVQEIWEYCTKVPFDDPLIEAAATALGIDKADLFRLASTFP